MNNEVIEMHHFVVGVSFVEAAQCKSATEEGFKEEGEYGILEDEFLICFVFEGKEFICS